MVVFNIKSIFKEGESYSISPFANSDDEQSLHIFVPRIIKLIKVRVNKVYNKKINSGAKRFFYATCQAEILKNVFLIHIYREINNVNVDNNINNNNNFNARIIEKNGLYNATGRGFDFNINNNNKLLSKSLKSLKSLKSKIKLIDHYY